MFDYDKFKKKVILIMKDRRDKIIGAYFIILISINFIFALYTFLFILHHLQN